MIALALALAPVARAQVVCPTCDHPTVQAAIDATPPGGTALVWLAAGTHHGRVTVDGGRSVTLLPLAVGDPVVLSADPGEGAVLTVADGELALVGLTVQADGIRAIDAADGAQVDLTLCALVGDGLAGTGALVRLQRGASLVASVTAFDGGYALGDGGQVAAYDSDFSCVGCSFAGGTGGRGGLVFGTSAEGSRHLVELSLSTLREGAATGDGGLVYVEGGTDLAIRIAQLTDGTALNGGILAVGPGDSVVTLEDADLSVATAIGDGGIVAILGGASFEAETLGVRDGQAAHGGGMAVLDEASGLTLRLEGALFQDNVAVLEGAGLWLGAGAAELVDSAFVANAAFALGGGIYVGAAADAALLRTGVCGNAADQGAGVVVASALDLEWRNVRLLDNRAGVDGGGLLAIGGGGLLLLQSNLLGNSSGVGGGAAISARAGTVELDGTLIGWSDGGVAVREEVSAAVLRRATAWWNNAAGDMSTLRPDEPGAIFQDPLLVRYVPGSDCDAQQDWPRWYSPLRDMGAADLQDRDDTRADLGAYGGPNAPRDLWTRDADEDGWKAIYDCDDRDGSIHPDPLDEPYDGLDANCDAWDDFDHDRDGQRSTTYGGPDCDDDDATVYAGAPETAEATARGVDADCDGALDADRDGFEPPLDCDDGDPSVYPSALDDDPDRDLDCDGFVDDPRALVPVGCATSGTGASPRPWLVALVWVLVRAARAGPPRWLPSWPGRTRARCTGRSPACRR